MMTLKHCLKRGAILIATIVVLPLIATAKLEQLLTRSESWFATCGMMLSLLPGKVGNYFRLAFYRLTLQRCSFDACFSFGVLVPHRTAEIGQYVTIGAYSIIGTVTIDDHVLIASRVSITSGGKQHKFDDLTKNITEEEPVFERVRIGSNTWIGEGAVIMADVGGRCVVSAGSVVSRAIPDGKLAMGNPARPISREFSNPNKRAEPAETSAI